MLSISGRELNEQTIAEHFARWSASLSRPAGPDRAMVEDACDVLYDNLGLPKPAIFWCKSYYQFILMPFIILRITRAPVFAAACQKLAPLERDDPAWLSAWNECWQSIWDTMSHQLFDAAYVNESYADLRQGLAQQLQEQMGNALRSERLPLRMDENPAPNIYGYPLPQEGTAAARLFEQWQRLEQRIEHVYTGLKDRNDIWALIDSYAHDFTRLRSRQGFTIIGLARDLGGLLELHAQWSFWLRHRTTFLARAALLAEIFPLEFERFSADLLLLETLEANCIGALVSDSRIFLCEKPVAAHFDEADRLHNERGAALAFADGLKHYALHGVALPANAIEQPDTITPEQIESAANMAQRWALMDLFGRDRYVATFGEVVHEDQFGTLYRKQFPGEEPLLMVAVKNSTPEPDGTYRTYFLRVPPDIQTAKEAVAWTFSMSPDEYGPLKET
jgi:hypothetical protein